MGGLPGEGKQHTTVDDALVATLVREQFPHLAELEIGRRYLFDDHLTVRLGDRLSVNLPTNAEADALIAESARWLLPAAAHWEFPVGVPLLTGEPSEDFPFHWEVAPWLPGSNATIVGLDRDAAPELGAALRQVHTPAAEDAPRRTGRSGPLSDLGDAWGEALRALTALHGPAGEAVDPVRLTDEWGRLSGTELDLGARWTHGNLDPRYVVSDRGQFRGICSWFTFGAGDPALDLGSACLTIPVDAEEAFLEGYGDVSDATRDRACGYRLLRAAEYATSTNPFLWRLGWDRLLEIEGAVGSGRR